MKGPLAACILAARGLPVSVPVCLLITTDEETTKLGARAIVERSKLARSYAPRGIVIAEPTRLTQVRGHRASLTFTIISHGVQAHSATGKGINANWALVEFLADMKAVRKRLDTDTSLQDTAYEPAISDFNMVIDNHGTAFNTTVPKATVRIKYRYSHRIDPEIISNAVREAAAKSGLELRIDTEGNPPELPPDHPLIRQACALSGSEAITVPFGTDASQLQALAPCVIIGPGDIGQAHRPGECVEVAELHRGVELFKTMASQT